VTGGTFYRDYANSNTSYPATVSDFCLDKYEITVGRFRAFLADYDRWISAGGGSHPSTGEGAHTTPAIPGTGWDTSWSLPASAAEFQNASHLTSDPSATWRAAAGSGSPAGDEDWPITCINWYEAFAFCIWDGGYLPTEAEWEYAAAGGSNEWTYPWGNTPNTDPLPANYLYTNASPFVAVGSYPAGNGRWGQADLAGSMWEWVFDWYVDPFSPATCNNCANTTASTYRVIRGGGWSYDANYLTAARRNTYFPANPLVHIAARCARIPR
jgi:formylglycine-generating enzyme required for sulfatase activity